MQRQQQHNTFADDRLEAKRQKALLPRLTQYTLPTLQDSLRTQEKGMIITREFAEEWRAWVRAPVRAPRPLHLTTDTLVCQHGLCNFELGGIPLFSHPRVVVLSIEEFAILCSLYPHSQGPPISIALETLKTTPAGCHGCITAGKFVYQDGCIYVQLIRGSTAGEDNVGEIICASRHNHYNLNSGIIGKFFLKVHSKG